MTEVSARPPAGASFERPPIGPRIHPGMDVRIGPVCYHSGPMGKIGFIFDLDNTLVASDPAWTHAETAAHRALGSEFDPQIAREYKGLSAAEVAAIIHRSRNSPAPLDEIRILLRSELIHAMRHFQLDPIPGALELVHRLQAMGPMAVASGSPLEAIDAVLQRLGIRECFRALRSSADVAAGKPAPDVFLAAREALDLPSSCCVIFEDSPTGVAAARAAGIACIVRPSVPFPDDTGGNHVTVSGWNKVSREQLTSLVG